MSTKSILGIILTTAFIFAVTISDTNNLIQNTRNIITTSLKLDNESNANPNLNKVTKSTITTSSSNVTESIIITSSAPTNKSIVSLGEEQSKVSKEKKDKLLNEITALICSDIDKIGVTYYDLESGDTILINDNKEFLAGSTVKIPITHHESIKKDTTLHKKLYLFLYLLSNKTFSIN